MNKIYKWYHGLSKQVHDSIAISVTVVGLLSTILSILGISLGDIQGLNLYMRRDLSRLFSPAEYKCPTLL